MVKFKRYFESKRVDLDLTELLSTSAPQSMVVISSGENMGGAARGFITSIYAIFRLSKSQY